MGFITIIAKYKNISLNISARGRNARKPTRGLTRSIVDAILVNHTRTQIGLH